MTGQGEQMVVDCCQWNPVTGEIVHNSVEEMKILTNAMLQLSDERMIEMNARMLAVYDFEKYFTVETWSRVVSILDVLAGRVDPQQVIQRWEASREETEELEKGRREVYEQMQSEADVISAMTNSNIAASCGCTVYDDNTVRLCEKHALGARRD